MQAIHKKAFCYYSNFLVSDMSTGADPGFGQGGGQVLRPKASNLWPGSMARLRALEAFGFLMLKYAFSHILERLL